MSRGMSSAQSGACAASRADRAAPTMATWLTLSGVVLVSNGPSLFVVEFCPVPGTFPRVRTGKLRHVVKAQPVRGPLTRELKDLRSPVRRFLSDRFTSGFPDVQRRYRQTSPSLVVPPAPRGEASPATIGTAADWLLRFLVHPSPGMVLPTAGAHHCRPAGLDPVPALAEIAGSLGVPLAVPSQAREVPTFTGPVPGSPASPEHLARACWAFALLTEVFRAGPVVLETGPLGRLSGQPSADALLDLAPAAGLSQLAQFRAVFEQSLLPQLATRPGLWAVGPTFAGSQLMKADADLIAGGLLLDLKTSAKFSLPAQDMLQVIGYALLDFDDEFGDDGAGNL